MPPEAMQLLQACLHPDPLRRMTAGELLTLPYFHGGVPELIPNMYTVTRAMAGVTAPIMSGRPPAMMGAPAFRQEPWVPSLGRQQPLVSERRQHWQQQPSVSEQQRPLVSEQQHWQQVRQQQPSVSERTQIAIAQAKASVAAAAEAVEQAGPSYLSASAHAWDLAAPRAYYVNPSHGGGDPSFRPPAAKRVSDGTDQQGRYALPAVGRQSSISTAGAGAGPVEAAVSGTDARLRRSSTCPSSREGERFSRGSTPASTEAADQQEEHAVARGVPGPDPPDPMYNQRISDLGARTLEAGSSSAAPLQDASLPARVSLPLIRQLAAAVALPGPSQQRPPPGPPHGGHKRTSSSGSGTIPDAQMGAFPSILLGAGAGSDLSNRAHQQQGSMTASSGPDFYNKAQQPSPQQGSMMARGRTLSCSGPSPEPRPARPPHASRSPSKPQPQGSSLTTSDRGAADALFRTAPVQQSARHAAVTLAPLPDLALLPAAGAAVPQRRKAQSMDGATRNLEQSEFSAQARNQAHSHQLTGCLSGGLPALLPAPHRVSLPGGALMMPAGSLGSALTQLNIGSSSGGGNAASGVVWGQHVLVPASSMHMFEIRNAPSVSAAGSGAQQHPATSSNTQQHPATHNFATSSGRISGAGMAHAGTADQHNLTYAPASQSQRSAAGGGVGGGWGGAGAAKAQMPALTKVSPSLTSSSASTPALQQGRNCPRTSSMELAGVGFAPRKPLG